MDYTQQQATRGADSQARSSRAWVSKTSETSGAHPISRKLSHAVSKSRSRSKAALTESEADIKPVDRTSSDRHLQKLVLEYPPPPDDRILRDISDDVRESLQDDKKLGPRRNKLMDILGTAVKSECEGRSFISLSTIDAAHLDKLLVDMLNPENHPEPMPVQFRADIRVAESLQRHWKTRFRTAYCCLDKERYARLSKPGGRLENVDFNKDAKSPHDFWQSKKSQALSEYECNDAFKEGHWWVNLPCAQRDGILCPSQSEPPRRDFDIPTLPLLKGTEVPSWPGGNVKYIREGTMADMWISLLTHTGKNVRVLRGEFLDSPFAPKAGIRYDGKYRLEQYGQIRNSVTKVIRLTLSLVRLPGQLPMHNVCRFPKPSQIDDWVLAERLEGDLVKAKCGEDRFEQWAEAKKRDAKRKIDLMDRLNRGSASAVKARMESLHEDGKGKVRELVPLKNYRRFKDLKWDR